VDVVPATLELVRDGRLDFTVDHEPYLQGFLPDTALRRARRAG
jgi:simple sugar transport system substrate-binding protein